jgi:hypothetical protein
VQQKAKETARIDVEFIECPQPQTTGMAEQLFSGNPLVKLEWG